MARVQLQPISIAISMQDTRFVGHLEFMRCAVFHVGIQLVEQVAVADGFSASPLPTNRRIA